MTSMKVSGTESPVQKEPNATMCRDDQLVKQFKPGDIAWVKTRDCSWWPAQVVKEESVNFRQKKKVKDGVLVRIYGSYEYMYVDPIKCCAEFEKFLKQDNLSIKEAFQKAMDVDLSRVRSAGKSKRNTSESRDKSEKTPKQLKPKDGREPKTRNVTEKAQIGTPKGKISKNQDAEEHAKTVSPCTTKNSTLKEPTPDPSARRTRVMQSLGLIAPLGSPYRPNADVLASSIKQT